MLEYIDPAMQKIAEQKESLIQSAVEAILGRDWRLMDIRKRCRFERILGEPWETLVVDGEPALMLFDMEVGKFEQRGESYISNVSQKYKFLGRADYLLASKPGAE